MGLLNKIMQLAFKTHTLLYGAIEAIISAQVVNISTALPLVRTPYFYTQEKSYKN